MYVVLSVLETLTEYVSTVRGMEYVWTEYCALLAEFCGVLLRSILVAWVGVGKCG